MRSREGRGVPDLSSPRAFAEALGRVVAAGWDSAVAEAFSFAFVLAVPGRMPGLVARWGGDEVLTVAWLVVRAEAGAVAHANDSWAYLAQATKYALFDAEKVEAKHAWAGCLDDVCDPDRPGGVAVDRLAVSPVVPPVEAGRVSVDDISDSELLSRVLDDIVAAGVPRQVAVPGLCRVLGLASERGARFLPQVARDDALLAALGFSPAAAVALMALVAGTRRRPDWSVLLNGGDDPGRLYSRLAAAWAVDCMDAKGRLSSTPSGTIKHGFDPVTRPAGRSPRKSYSRSDRPGRDVGRREMSLPSRAA